MIFVYFLFPQPCPSLGRTDNLPLQTVSLGLHDPGIGSPEDAKQGVGSPS